MRVGILISKIYPDIIIDVDFVLKEDETGIGKWITKKYIQPTQAELETAWIEVEKEIQAKEASIQKSKDINALFGEEDKLEAVVQQINLIAEVLDTVTSENPSQETIAYAKSKFGEVRNILTK